MGSVVIVHMDLRSARKVGALLLAVPLLTGLAGSFFPSYDARSRYFASSFHNIVEAGNDYLVALVLFLVVAVVLVTLAVGLSRSPLRSEASLGVVIGGLGVSGFGFATAAVTGLPVWGWASHVADGSEPLGAMAARSESLASISQTVLLMFGFNQAAHSPHSASTNPRLDATIRQARLSVAMTT